jgi:hypothetical protein
MPLSRRTLLATMPFAGLLAAGVSVAGAEPYGRISMVPTAAKRPVWISGVSDPDPVAFGDWRGSPVDIVGMFGDASVQAQAEQWVYTHNYPSFRGDVDLAVGGPIDHTWAQVAAGADVARWRQTAAVLRANWHYRTVYLRYAHEANGDWMDWSVARAEVPHFIKAFRRFSATMRQELRGKNVKIVFAPNFGTWPYTPDSMWPGSDVVDVVGLSIYEWTKYDSWPKWSAFIKSPIGPDYWLNFARRHGKPLAFSEWGGQSAYFIKAMHDWTAVHAGTGAGRLLYEVYLNADKLALTGSAGKEYQHLRWGR